MITSECLCRTLFYATNKSCGTCFSYEKNKKQVLITARHIFESVGFPTLCKIKILTKAGFNEYDVKVYYHDNPEIDVAIIDVDESVLTKVFAGAPIYSSVEMIVGQECYFLGYPYSIVDLATPKGDNPIPMVKKATISGTIKENGTSYILLDGINNSGFSGGPVCFKNTRTNKFHIMGVVNGYKYNKKYLITKECKLAESEELSKCYIEENTGIIYSTDIKHAVEIIDKHIL